MASVMGRLDPHSFVYREHIELNRSGKSIQMMLGWFVEWERTRHTLEATKFDNVLPNGFLNMMNIPFNANKHTSHAMLCRCETQNIQEFVFVLLCAFDVCCLCFFSSIVCVYFCFYLVPLKSIAVAVHPYVVVFFFCQIIRICEAPFQNRNFS